MGRPARFLELWQKLEVRLAIWVVTAEIVTLTAWVALKGFASYYTEGGNIIGVIMRSVVSAIALGFIAWFSSKKLKGLARRASEARSERSRERGLSPSVTRWLVVAGIGVGLLLGPAWANVGSDWASNAVGWLQNASALTLIGGPRGLVTRLTLWLALLGGSIAAGRGKHINIDVAVRYLPKQMATPVALLGWATAAVVCLFATFGFVDSIAVTKYRAEAFTSCPSGLCDTPISGRLRVVAEGTRTDFFLFRKQVALDLRTLPRVLGGTPYDRWMKAEEWNEFIREGGFDEHFPKEAVHGLLAATDDPSSTKMPIVVDPTSGEGRNSLIRDLDFVLPFGLLMIALKFLLRILLVLTKQVKLEGEEQHA